MNAAYAQVVTDGSGCDAYGLDTGHEDGLIALGHAEDGGMITSGDTINSKSGFPANRIQGLEDALDCILISRTDAELVGLEIDSDYQSGGDDFCISTISDDDDDYDSSDDDIELVMDGTFLAFFDGDE